MQLNLESTRGEIKVKIEGAKEEWEKHTKRMKKKKEEEMLDTQEKEFDVKDEDEEKLRNKTLKSTQKGIVKRKERVVEWGRGSSGKDICFT